MPEQLVPSPSPQQQQPHAKSLRENALRRLSRSPHPYHHQQFELPHSSERFDATAPPSSSLRSADDNSGQVSGRGRGPYRDSTGSDSGTEADDEHFLKGLPAPKLRLHKGLRGADWSPSASPSPRLSPTLLNDDPYRSPGSLRRSTLPLELLSEDDDRNAAEKFRQKRRVEVVRRTTETALLVGLGCIICLDPKVRRLLWFLRRELACQFTVTLTLLALYPIRLLRHLDPSNKWRQPYPIAIPAAFDPAPLLYPPILTFLVTSLLLEADWMNMMPSMILGIASLPRHLIPSTGGWAGSNMSQWLLSCFPLFCAHLNGQPIDASHARNPRLKGEILILIPPLHQALCVTLNFLTTTSLLEAELQLLSIALIHLLLLATSPQTLILKSLLWGGGVGVLVTCCRVLQWGVALARVPKWRFRRTDAAKSRIGRGLVQAQKTFELGRLGALLAMDAVSDTSDDGGEAEYRNQREPLSLKINTSKMFSPVGRDIDGSASAIEPKRDGQSNGNMDGFFSFVQRRHTLPSLTQRPPPKASKKTSLGRKRRAQSSSVQAFFSLTQKQAAVRKWAYAGYVYLSIILIILIGIREYVGKYALYGNEPVGWALGYMFGDISWFRMQVILANLQRWICVPPRTGNEHAESCHLGWVQYLRHATFGEANTRLIICLYWLCIIVVGLAVVFRLSVIYEVDTRRKVFHFMMVAMLLPATYVDPTFAALALSLMLAIFLILDLFRASQLPPLSKSLAYFLTPYVDGRDLKGPVVISHIFLLIGCAIPLWLSLGALPRSGSSYLQGWEVPTREVSMVSGVICVGMGDAAASLIGRRYGRRKWLWGGGKSIEGSVAFAMAVALALGLAKAWLRLGGWAANNTDGWAKTGAKSLVCAGFASATEAVLTGGNDNVVVPVVLWVCVKGLDI